MEPLARIHRILLASLLIFTCVCSAATARQAASTADAGENGDEDKDRKVMERFLMLLEKTPRRGTALDRVYGYHVERGSLDAFVKTYEERTKANPQDGAAWLILGLIEAQRGRDAASVVALRKASEARAEDPLPPYYLGQALVLVGQPDMAAEAFETAIARKPPRTDLLDIFQSLGRVYQRAHRTEQALAVWTRLEKLFPDDARVQEQIATALAEESQPELALPRYEALAKKATDSYRKVQFRMDAAELKVRLGKRTEALADFETMLGQLNPDSWLYREVRRKIEEVFLRNDDLAGLASYYERWLKTATEDVDAMARLGRTLALQGRIPESRVWFDKAVKLAPSRKELRLALVEQLVQDKKFAEAGAQYEAMVKNDPNNPDLIREWGRLILKDTTKAEPERKKSAGAVWRRLLEARPKDPAIATQIADLFRQAEMTDDAITLYKRAIEIAPEAPQYREYLGEYYHALKRPKDAIETWSAIAGGKNRNAKNLGRLAEVLAGFGYKKEALVPVAEACALAKDDFDLNFKYADLLQQLERFDDALKQLALAEGLADDQEQRTAVLAARIKNLQGAGRLTAEAETLQKELVAAKDAPAGRWVTLARYLEADGKLPEATAAVKKAIELDGKSIAAWSAAARIQELAGNFGAAADCQRKLAELDRRARTDYLTEVAKLETRLGRKDQALKAGRDLLAAAPGNPESYQFFADLCFQLGETEEGFSALRRAVRVNPGDAKAMLTLAESLAQQFRTEEAIELYWRAFEKGAELEGKLDIVARLTSLYLQRNQFDRLVARLEREQREGDKQREMTICLAQAYSASGDFGTARQALERLLTSNARDGQLLQQLSMLAETEGDVAAAAKYQKQINEFAPTEEGTNRLAQLYVRAGEASEAEAIWTSMANKDEEPHRILQSLDSLLGHAKYEAVLAITERLLRKNPANWEALYREGVALANTDKRGEAAQRFHAILALHVPDDEESLLAKARKRTPQAGRPAAVTSARARIAQLSPIQQRVQSAMQIRLVTGLESRANYGYSNAASSWAPAEFGQARMAALGWLFSQAEKDNTKDQFLKTVRDARKLGKDARALRDDYYLQTVRNENKEAFEAAKVLARVASTDPGAQYVFLNAVPGRFANAAAVRRQVANAVDNVPALSAEDLDQVMAGYRVLRQRKPEWLQANLLSTIATELKRAKKTKESEEFYQELVTNANTIEAAYSVLTLAGERGDVSTCLAMRDKLDRLKGSRLGSSYYVTPSGVYIGDPSTAFIRAMSVRADAKAYADVLKLLDHYLDGVRRRHRDAAQARSRSSTNLANVGNSGYYQVWLGSATKGVRVSFPSPNDYFDSGAITVLREAFELYKRDDLFSDLLAHFKDSAKTGAEPDPIYPHLALCYLDWWNDDRDEAVAELTLASEAIKSDTALRLELAALREQRGERDEALTLVDSIEPLDNATMQQRETMALRLAVLTGNVDRARQAAERLFNLRLDTDTQVQLAAQMHQLGMHEMAEAVLGRARRRAGNRTATLVSLMSQYQRQNQPDLAIQVAYQILRKMPTQISTPYRNSEDDTSRREAIQTLARSGKLKEMIERAEAQLKSSPNNTQLLQMLADYYKAANDREKMKAVYERIAKLKPDDAKVQYQIGQQLVEAGETAASLEHFKVAIKKEPSLFAYRYYEIQNAFQQNNKLDDLMKIFEEIDLKAIGQVWNVTNILSQLFRDPKSHDRGLALFRKAWKAFPNERAELMGNLYDDSVWRLPEMYDYAREAVIPVDTQAQLAPWLSIDQIISYSGDGRVNGLLGRLITAASQQNKLGALRSEIETKLKTMPEWAGGKAILAIIDAKQGKVDEAKRILTDLLANHAKAPIPSQAAWVVGLEIEDLEPLREVAESLYQLTIKDMMNDNMNSINQQFEYSPARRLVYLYKKMGRNAEAREIVLKFTRKIEDQSGYPAYYVASQNMERQAGVASQLADLGFPADAVRVYGEMLGDTEGQEAVQAWRGGDDYIMRQAQEGLKNAMRAIKDETIAPTLRTLLTPNKSPGGPMGAIDLALLVFPRNLDEASVTGLLAEMLKAASAKPELMAEADGAVAKLCEQYPTDYTVAIASVLVAFAQDKPDAIDRTVNRLTKLMNDVPLEPLSGKGRANARQRAEAANQIGLWLVARGCWKRDSTRALGDRFAERAIAAARRQAENSWTLAMLREWGQVALDAGDRATAETRWGLMLDMVLEDPLRKNAASNRNAAVNAPLAVPAAATTAAPPTPTQPCEAPATSAALDDGEEESQELLLAQAATTAQAPMPTPARARTSPPAVAGRTNAAPAVPRIPPTTITRFEQAAQIAKLALKNKMPDLSLRAIRESLVGGPPVKSSNDVKGFGFAASRQVRMTTTSQEEPIPIQVEERIAQLDGLWQKMSIPPKAVYTTLRDVVLPEGRPTEVFLYPQPMNGDASRQARSVSSYLARAAVRAGQTDDLRKQLESRKTEALSEFPAQILLGQIALASKDTAALNAALDYLANRLKTDSLQTTATQACLIALPALDFPGTEKQAVSVLETVAKNLSTNEAEEPLNTIQLTVARYYLRQKNLPAAKKQLQEYMSALDRSSLRYGGDYSVYRRKLGLQRLAIEYLTAGDVQDALDILGQFADIPTPSNGDPDISGNLAALFRLISARPADERYDLLKTWSLPAASRKSIRLFAAFVPEDIPPEVFGKVDVLRRKNDIAEGAGELDPRGVASTVNMLIDAARESGKLDELAAEAKNAADEKIENGAALRILVEVARDQPRAVESLVKAAREALPKKSENPTEMPGGQSVNAQNRVRQIEWPDYLIAHACAKNASLAAHSLPMLKQLLAHAQKTQSWIFMTHLEQEIGELEIVAAGGSIIPPGADPGLALWKRGSISQSWSRAGGYPEAWWAAHDGQIGHINGNSQDNLYFRYPLAGKFEFSFDAYDGGWAEGQIQYGGLSYLGMALDMNSQVSTVDGQESFNVPCKSLRREAFNHYTLAVEPGKVRCSINGRLFYEDTTPSALSPWLALTTSRERHTVWKNLKLTGEPVIPREVVLSQGNRLDGWVANHHGGNMAPFRNTQPDPNEYYGRGYTAPSAPEDYDWHSKDGVIFGKRRDGTSTGANPAQGWLFYPPPLADGDSLRYEFFYEPGETLVHPTFDHLAFLLEPSGVRLHWITDTAENDWTGYVVNNAVDEPANRRGSGPLPLKEKDWNALKLSLADGVVTIELNGAPIYQRPLERTNGRYFGLYHYKDQSSVRVRNVVLRGNWPEKLTADQLADLAQRSDGKNTLADKVARHALIGERFFAQQSLEVVARARALSPNERYALLAEWVLPNAEHPTFRLYADFTPGAPAPPVAPPRPPGAAGNRIYVGGELKAPAIELVAAAKETGQLDALSERVEKAQPKGGIDVRGRLALLAMIREAQGRDAEAVEFIGQLLPELKKLSPDEAINSRWAELVVGTAVVANDRVRPALLPLLNELVEQTQRKDPGAHWDPRVRHARGVAQWLSQSSSKGVRFGTPPKSRQWKPVIHGNSMSRGYGYNAPHWSIANGEALHYPGHHFDYLYFNSPLRGNFELNCELSAFGWREGRISYAGLHVGFLYTKKNLELGHYGRMFPQVTLEKPLEGVGDSGWYPYRLVVKDGTYTSYVNGVKVYEQSLPAEPDPWLAVYVFEQYTGGARNLTITGSPTIPDRLNLSNLSDLTGWRAEYYEESISGENPAWQKRGEEFRGQKLEAPRVTDRFGRAIGAGTGAAGQTAARQQESVLQYHRPMLEDGEIEYEFYYEPGKAHTHPALDRLTFLLAPEGVRIHWMTDAKHDRTGLLPDNVSSEPSIRRGPDTLPLKPKDWNKLKLALVGDQVTLTLNDVVICERNLEPTNQRSFGLFHFADESEVRVRKVTYRGDWPKTLPERQELALPGGKP